MSEQDAVQRDKRSTMSGCGVTTGLGLIVIGSLLLAGMFLDLPFRDWAMRIQWDWAWTLFVIAPGVVMLLTGLFGPRDSAGLVIPGSIVTTIGLILLGQVVFEAWSTWAYAWTLIVASVGLGLFLFGLRTRKPQVRRTGSVMLAAGLIAFVGFAFFFEVVIGLGGFFSPEIRRAVLPALVILAGIFIVISSFGPKKASPAGPAQQQAQPTPQPAQPAPPEPGNVTPGAPEDRPPSA